LSKNHKIPKKLWSICEKDFAKWLDSCLSYGVKLTSPPIQDAPTPKVTVMETKAKGKAVIPAAECCKGQRRDGGMQLNKQLRDGPALFWWPRGIVPPPPPPPSKSLVSEAGRRAIYVPYTATCGVTGKKERFGKSQNSEDVGCWNPLFTIRQFDPGRPSKNARADHLTEVISPIKISTTSGPNNGRASTCHHAGGRDVGIGMKPLAGQRNKQALIGLNHKQVKEYMPKKM
jgi:hypothetical protein